MLVLGREVNEKIHMRIPAGTVFPQETDLVVMVVRTGVKTRLAFEAPACVRILRGELLSGGKRKESQS